MDEEAMSSLANRLIFVNRIGDNDVEGIENSNIYFSDTSFSVPITRVKTNNFSVVYRVLQSFKRKLSLKTLRLFRETAYNIAISQNPEDKILVTNLQTDTTNGLDFVFGHGAIKQSGISKKGIVGLIRDDVWKNLLSIEEEYSSEDIFQGLAHITKSSALIPLGKYFIETGRAKYDDGWTIDVPDDYTENQQSRLLDYFGKELSDFAPYMPATSTLNEFRKKYKSIDDLTSSISPIEAIKKIAWLELSSIDSDKLKAFLVSVYHLPKDQTTNSSFTKLIALYDHMKYVLPAEVDFIK